MDVNLKELPVEDRISLVEDLWDSIANDQKILPLTPKQVTELDCRLDAFEVDDNLGRPAAEAILDIRRRL
jgi:putative addiction module component (TIGR02574 family)